MAQHVEGGLGQRQEIVIAKGAAESRLAQLAHQPHALGAQTLVSPVAATGGDDLVPGGDQLADKPIAGKRAGAGEQDPHRGRSAFSHADAAPSCGGRTCSYIADMCEYINYEVILYAIFIPNAFELRDDRAVRRPGGEFRCQSAAGRVLRPPIPLPAGSRKSVSKLLIDIIFSAVTGGFARAASGFFPARQGNRRPVMAPRPLNPPNARPGRNRAVARPCPRSLAARPASESQNAGRSSAHRARVPERKTR